MIKNLVNTLANANEVIQKKMIENFTAADEEDRRRVAEGLKEKMPMKEGSVGVLLAATMTDEGVKQAQEVSTEAKPY